MNFKLLPFIFLFFNYSDCSKLNLPRVLLPIFKTFSTNYTLEVTGFGCYKWSSSRVDVVQVTLVEENKSKGCSQKAIVSSVGRVSSRTMTIVLAEEIITGQIFRADVIVDTIASLNIITTTRELYMEEPPEMFEVRAYDAEGNEFTTLEGVELEWTLVRERFGQEVIRFISFRESTYETPSSIGAFDAVGKQGHIVLLEGIRTGTSKVLVRLAHAEYQLVPSAEVTISVIANLIIDPSDVYIMQGDRINFRILQVRQGRLIEIKKSSNPQYILTPEDNGIVEVENQVVRGLNLGRCKLVLRDLNSNSVGYEQQKLPHAHVTVVQPAYISLTIYPFNNWAMFTDQPATLITEVYDSDNRKVTMGESSHVDMRLDESIFGILWRSGNGSYADGETISVGVTEVKAELLEAGAGMESNSRALLKTYATVHVFPPLTLHPPVVAFPYHHTSISWNEIEMRVEGGDGINLWNTHNHSVAVVNQAGVLKPMGEGETKVEVAMVRNENLKATSSVLVLKPHTMEILGGVHEAPVGSHIYLDVALYGLNKDGIRVAFTDCSQVTFSVSVDQGFQYDGSIDREPSSGACAAVSLLAKQDSKSLVVISISDGSIQAETLVAAFKPLFLMHPPYSKPVVLAVKSSRHIVFTGGPKPWFGKVVSSYSSSTSILQAVLHHESQELYVYNVMCNKVGTSEFTLTTFTEPYIGNITPVKSQSTVTVICGKPKHLELSANMGPECPVSDLDRALATKNSKVKIRVVVRDGEGRKFDNATSLLYKWFWPKDHLFTVDEPDRIYLRKEVHPDFILPLDHYKELNTKNSADSATIKLKAVGYLHDKLSTEIRAEGLLSLNIVDGLITEPNSVTLMNRVGAQSMVTLHHGSGYFDVESTQNNVCVIEFDPSLKRVVWIKPVLDGRVDLKIIDKCLQSSSAALHVQVVNIGSIRIQVTARMELNRITNAVIKLYDTLDRELTGDIDDIAIESSTQGIITVSRLNPNDPRLLVIKGLQVGRTSLVATFNNISSPPAQIQVFTAIKLSPRNITLVMGAEYQVRVTGGPGPDLHFSMSDTSVASISNTGLISAHLTGESWVSVSTEGGEGRDSIGVTVVPLAGVQISGPTALLCVTGRAPLWAQPVPHVISPLVLASVHPPLTYSWTSSHPGVAHITDRFSQVTIHVKEEDRLSVEVRGVKPGRTVIHLRLTGGSTDHGVYEASFELSVVEELVFSVPPASIPAFIVAPNTHFTLKTNLEEAEMSVTSLVSDSCTKDGGVSVSAVDERRVITLNRDGSLKSGACPGTAVVTAQTTHPKPTLQSTALFLQVKVVHYMMVNIANVVNASASALSGLPRGLDLLLNVTYHDSLGRSFYAAPSKVTLRFNRHDKALKKQGWTNSSFIVGLEGSGVTVLHASDPISPISQDYLKIPVENHILPLRRQMTVGEVVCFVSVMRRGSSVVGTWASEGDSVSIGEVDGMARAVKPGPAVITYRETSQQANIQTSINIDVLPLHSLSFGGGISISNADFGKEYIVGVKLVGEKSRESSHLPAGPCLSNRPVTVFPFHCQIRFNSLSVAHPISSIFSVAPTFDRQSGGFGCLVRVVGGISPNTSVISSNVTLRVANSLDSDQQQSVYSLDTPAVQADSVVLEFHPAIFLATPQLSLAKPSSVVHLVVVATPHVAHLIIVEAGDRTVVKVGDVERRGSVSWVWPIQLYREQWPNYHSLSHLSLVILSPLTNQTLKVEIVTGGSTMQVGSCVYTDNSGWTVSDLVPSATTSIFVALMAIIVFFMASNYCYNSFRGQPTISPRHSPSHASLQEYSLGSRTPTPNRTHRPVVYGSPNSSTEASPLNKSPSPTRLRRLYQ